MTVVPLDLGGDSLSVSWEEPSCPGAADYQILYGGGSQMPDFVGGDFGLLGSECALGAPPFNWTGSPDPASDPSGWIWWVVVANGGSLEGSWGTDSFGNERSGPLAGGFSGECGNSAKNFCNTCSP